MGIAARSADRLAQALVTRTARERWLIALLMGIVVPVGLIAAVAQPMAAARTAALAELDSARDLADWVAERRAVLPPLPAARTAVANVDPIGISGIEASLVAAGLRPAVASLSNAPDGGISLRFESVQFSLLMPWVDDTEALSGYVLSAFRIAALDRPDLVQAELELDRRP